MPSEIIQQLKIYLSQIQPRNHNSKNQPFTFTNSIDNTNTYLEVPPTEQNMDMIVHSQPKDKKSIAPTETDFSSTLDNGTLFLSHTINTLLIIDLENNNNKDTNNNNNNYEN